MVAFFKGWMVDEKAIATGIILSALMAGVGILQFWQALAEPSELGYLKDMFNGLILWIPGSAGVIGCLSIFYNYRATV